MRVISCYFVHFAFLFVGKDIFRFSSKDTFFFFFIQFDRSKDHLVGLHTTRQREARLDILCTQRYEMKKDTEQQNEKKEEAEYHVSQNPSFAA